MLFILLGVMAGLIGGMGIGGGTILIPSLIFLTDLNQQTIQSINLISFVPVAIVALFVHFRKGNIVSKLSLPLIGSGILGTIIGSKLALKLSSVILRKWFGGFLLVIGLYEVFFKGTKKK